MEAVAEAARCDRRAGVRAAVWNWLGLACSRNVFRRFRRAFGMHGCCQLHLFCEAGLGQVIY
jgi:hypothetical protein